MNWACDFVDYAKPLTKDGRNVLLIYDAYGAHISLQVLQILHEGNIIVYVLSAHTSGRTQPLDIVLFSVFKSMLSTVLSGIVLVDNTESLNLFDICAVMREAYDATFTSSNIRAGFRRAGIWPFNPAKLLSESMPRSNLNNSDILSIEELTLLFEKKRDEYKTKVLGSDAVITISGYLDTTQGCVMTAAAVMELVRKKEENYQRKCEAEEEAQRKREAKEMNRRLMAIERHKSIDTERIQRQAILPGMTVETFKERPRSLKERLLVARRNAKSKLSTF